MTNKEQIDLLLDGYPQLKCNIVYTRNINYIKKVLNLPYWNFPIYKKLLTTNIWYSSYENIINILELPYWHDPKFKAILTIFSQWKEEHLLHLPEP